MSSSSLLPILTWLGYPAGGNPTQYVTEKAFRHHDLDWRYLTLEVRPEDLADAVRGMRAMGFSGGNVGSPHKDTIASLLDRTTETAELSGYVNVLLRDPQGLVGENTEGRAVVEAIRQQVDLGGKRVLLVGAGRVARATAVALAVTGVAHVTVLNRTATRAAELVHLLTDRLGVAAACAAWDEAAVELDAMDIVIHAATLPAGESEAGAPLDWTRLDPRTLVADATIDPPTTRLLAMAEECGCAAVTGLEILSRQMAINIRLWTGVDPDLTLVREALEEFLEL